ALDDAPAVAALWEQLLALHDPRWEWNRSGLGTARHQVLGSMIGRKVAPWGVAAGVAGGYVLVILAAQLLVPTASRPKAFVASLATALVLSGALLGMGMARHGDRS